MSLIVKHVPVEDFEDWCAKQGIDIVIEERSGVDAKYSGFKFYGNLRKGNRTAEISVDRRFLSSPCSNGATVRDSIRTMAHDFSEKLIVLGAYTNSREEIQCPRFTVKP